MKRKEFQNLPSTETPITAENLNEMQDNIEESCVAISPTQLTTNERVWIQKGKNLFNKNSGIVSGSFLGGDGSIGTDITLFYQNTYIPVLPNTTYTISSSVGESHRIAEYDKNKTFIKRNLNVSSGSTKYSITTSSNCYFVRVSCNISNLDTIQLEQGSTATEYEAYVEKAIYTKNDNGVYEELIKKAEDIQTISNDNGTAIKFSDGTMIVTQTYSQYQDCTTEYGGFYSTLENTPPDFPVSFISKPTINISATTANCFVIAGETVRTENNAGTFKIVGSERTQKFFGVNITAIGKWK